MLNKIDRFSKILLYIIADVLIAEFSVVAGIALWYDGSIPGAIYKAIPDSVWQWFSYMAVVTPFVVVIVYALFNLYNNLWKYASIDEVLKIIVATVFVFVALYFYDLLFVSSKNLITLPRRMLFVAWMVNTTLVMMTRFGYRAIRRSFVVFSHILSSKAGCKRVLVIGAGFTGYGVVSEMLHSKIRDRIPVIIVDDDPQKANSNILGVRVINGVDRVEEYVKKFQADEIIIALSSYTNAALTPIIQLCAKTGLATKILPPISDVSDRALVHKSIRNISISDLLPRDEIVLDTKNISQYLNGRVVLVTGGGGSIGSELCRQIAKFSPKQLVIFDIYENNAYDLMRELKLQYKDSLNVELRIGSVRDAKRLDEIFSEFSPNVVFHAAAHKHVTTMEQSPAEAIKNNVFGVYNTAKCANKYKTERFVLISTDKAVNPTCVMGASKRVTELIMQSMAEKSETKFVGVRFGNVLGSNGSVLSYFMKQIESGGPVTVTHPEVSRYFMTIPEASQLVLQAAAIGKSGRIYVLDMGEPVKMLDLVENLIRLSGYKPYEDVNITFIGLLPGEKLHEELILDEERDSMQVTSHKKIFVTKPVEMDYAVFEKQLKELKAITGNNPEQVDACLRKILPGYRKQ